jgi:spore coat protein CotH
MKTKIYIIVVLLFFFKSNSYSQNSLLINEFEAKNGSTVKDNFGEYNDWIEIMNVSNQSIDLNGYYITNDLAEKTKNKLASTGSDLTLAPGGFLMLWADKDLTQGNNHLNFKLGDSSLVAIYSTDLSLIDSVTFYKQYTNISMGRDPNNSKAWKFFSSPTPGKANSSNGFLGVTDPPVFSRQSGIYSSAMKVGISTQTGNPALYTLNSADPKSTSLVYSDSIPVSKTRVIRAIDYKDGWINSPITSQIYLENVNYTLPVLAIITDSLNLFDTKTGIYTNYTQSGSDWERNSQLKYISGNTLKMETRAGIRIQGNSSIFMSKKSFRLFFNDVNGDGILNYPFFGKNNFSSFDKLVLKSGYDDDITYESSRVGTLLRDAMSIELWKQAGGLPQLSQFCILYLNDRYWGIYDIRESIEDHYIEAHTGLKNFDLVRFHNEGPELKFGTMTEWNKLFAYIKNNDFSNQEKYDSAAIMMDMDNFVTLLAFAQCAQYYSWPWGISMYRDSAPGGKFKFSIWDTDRAYTDTSWNGFDEAQNRTDSYFWGNIFAKKLISNKNFKLKYATKIDSLLKTVFKPDNAIRILDSIYSIVKPEITSELNRWNPTNKNWEVNVEAVREFLRRRPAILQNQMKSVLPPVNINSENTISGDFQVYPNPFNSIAKIKIGLETESNVNLSVYDPFGRLITTIFHGNLKKGEHIFDLILNNKNNFNSKSGIYIINFKTPVISKYLKVIQVK